jgi:N-acetylneuraminic acid mutarotase
MKRNWLIVFVILLILPFCKEDFVTREFPSVLTKGIDNSNGNSVILTGELINRSGDKIDEAGFVWQAGTDPINGAGYSVNLADIFQKGIFTYKIENSLSSSTTYYVRAYAKQNGYTIYGQAISFTPKQTLALPPVHISPQTGQAGDTVTISGILFNSTPLKTKVKFESYTSKIVSIKDTVLKCIVPLTVTEKVNSVWITMDEVESKTNQSFTLLTPVIDMFNPQVVRVGDTVTIYGSAFHSLKSMNIVKIGTKDLKVTKSSTDELKVTVPFNTDSLGYISVTVSGQTAVSQNKIHVKQPDANTFYPLTGKYLDTIDLYFKNVDLLSVTEAKFGTETATIIDRSGSVIRVKVPVTLFTEQSVVSVSIGTEKFQFADKFILDQPQIISVSSAVSTSGAEVSVTGHNFNPVSNNENAFLKDSASNTVYNIIINYASTDSLVIKLTQKSQGSVPNGTYYLGLKTCENTIWADASIKVKVANVWTRLGDFPGGARYKGASFTVNGKGYMGMGTMMSSNVKNDLWEFDPVSRGWTQKADFPAAGRILPCVFQNSTSGFVGGGQSVDNSSQIPFTDFYKFTPSTNSWTRVAEIPSVERSYPGASASVSESVHVANLASQLVVEYNSGSDTWETPYNGIAATNREPQIFSINGKVYFIGGANNQLTNGTNNQVWEYDPDNNSMTRKNDFPGTSRYGGFSFAIGNRGYIGCGLTYVYNPVNIVYLTDVWKYNPDSDSWSSLGDFPGGFKHTCNSFVIGERAYIMTGWNNSDLTSDVWEFFDITNK